MDQVLQSFQNLHVEDDHGDIFNEFDDELDQLCTKMWVDTKMKTEEEEYNRLCKTLETLKRSNLNIGEYIIEVATLIDDYYNTFIKGLHIYTPNIPPQVCKKIQSICDSFIMMWSRYNKYKYNEDLFVLRDIAISLLSEIKSYIDNV